MDGKALRDRLRSAEIVVGDVSVTGPEFIARPGLHPIGFVAFDLDYYSSTAAALELLSAGDHSLLPPAFFHFDDVVGDALALHSEYTRELLAIAEFNACPTHRTLVPSNSPAYKHA